MNKKVNTLLFILGATVFNVLIAILVFVILTLLYVRYLMGAIPEANRSWGFTVIFLAAIAVSFVVYRVIFNYLLKKVDVEKYFDSFFSRKYFKRRD